MNVPKLRQIPPILAIALLSYGAVGVALLMQITLHLTPCPLCILQRVLYLAAGTAAIASAWRPIRIGGALLAILAACAGVAVSGWHVYIQANPAAFATCTPGIGYLLDNFPLTDVLPVLLKGGGQCFHIDRTFFGVTIPQMSLATFLALVVLGIRALIQSIRLRFGKG